MHITGMTIEGVPPFTEPVEFEFDERVNLFVGPNAVGKTTILYGVSEIPSGPPYRSVIYPYETGDQRLSVSSDWPMAHEEQLDREYGDSPAPKWDETPFVYVASTRLNLPGRADFFGNIDEVDPIDSRIVQESITKPLVATSRYGRLDAFDARVIRSAVAGRGLESEHLDIAIEERGMAGIRQQFPTAIELGLRCTRNICNEVITSSSPGDFVEPGEKGIIHLGRNTWTSPPVLHRGMGIATVDLTGEWYDDETLYAGNLSAGSQGTLMWVWLLSLKMVHHYRYRGGWQNQPAILLIDEIENHLHPTWQRRVIPALLDHFPGLQIFATTHSPFVVAGLKAGQVHMLKRDADGVVTASTNEHDIIGWTTDEILRTFMGVDEPTDQLTIDRANRLRELRRKEVLTDAEKDEMEALRKQVNADFLRSVTPLGRERERLGDMMMEFLRSRQSDLSQDGG